MLLLDVLTWQVPWPSDFDLYFALQWLTHFASRFNISSTIRPTTIKPCNVVLLNVLSQQIPWPGDLDLYFGCSDFDIIYVNVPDLFKCKISSHQTLHSASPGWTDSAGILTRWPWPIFCAPVVPFTHFMSTFNISLTIRSTTFKPSIVFLLNVRRYLDWVTLTYISRSIDFYIFYISLPYVLNSKAFNHQTLYIASSQCTDSAGTLTWWPWPIFCTPVTLTRNTLMFGISSNIRPTTTKPCIVLRLIALAFQVPWPDDRDLYLTHFTLMFDNSSTIRPTTTIPCIVLLLDVLN